MSSSPNVAGLFERLAMLPQSRYAPGEVVLATGERTGRLLILEHGSVEVIKDGVTIAEVAEPGTVFGEISALLDQPHGADVRAVEAATFRVADAAAFLRTDPMAALHVATILARRLDAANHHLLEAKGQLLDDHRPRSAIGDTLDAIARALTYGGPPI
jgi:CRP/FNR family cyclic AMP-dependent transcriptional regulator